VLSIIAWVVFGVLLWGRWRFGWRGPVAIRWTLGGIFSLMLAYFGTKLVLDLILHRVAG
ncbi:MAG TPA: phosphohydrolase, partial [Chromatiales bacterium]|nr:phosphohydrolase [Chromatiales bacterium]